MEKKKERRGEWSRDGPCCCSYPSIPRRTSSAGCLLLCDHRPLLLLIWSLWKLMGCLWGKLEVCGSMEEVVVVVLVAQEQLDLLYRSWIGDSSLLVLNRGMEHSRDVDDHIWTERQVPRLSARQSMETTVEAQGSDAHSDKVLLNKHGTSSGVPFRDKPAGFLRSCPRGGTLQ